MNQALATSSLDSSPETTRFGSGKSVKRLEDQQLLLGAGQYTNDVTLPGQSYLVFLRSPYPHATITRLDTLAAKAMPGVYGLGETVQSSTTSNRCGSATSRFCSAIQA